MSFANHNILDIALSVIPPTVVQIRKSLSTVINKFGQSEGTYSDWIDVYGIVQPGGEQNEHVNGVDISKRHVTIWLRGIALDGTHVQWKPDQIKYVGGIFNVVGVKDWYPYDNYRECDCVEAMNTPESQPMQKVESDKPSTPNPNKKIVRRKGRFKMVTPIEDATLDSSTDVAAEAKADTAPMDVVEEKVEDFKKPASVGKGKIRF